MKDSFGVDVAPGDYILSAPSNKWGMPKIGTVYAAKSGRLMVDVLHGPASERSKVEVGSGCAVLRKANGDVPAHIGYSDRIRIDDKWREIAEPPEFSERHTALDVYDLYVYREDS